jgi:hypothetical protein
MKFDVADIKKAINKIEEYGKLGEVDLEFDHLGRLELKYSEPMGGDRCTIVLFPSDTEKMAEITTTTLLR